MPQIAKVAVSAANYAIDKPYDYLLPDGTDAAVGSRVLVPFGRGNRLTEGMILSLERKTPEKALKAVREVLEPEPVCSEREIRLALWMRQRYFCTFYDAIRTILPAGVWYRYRQFWKLADYAGEDALSEKEKPLYALLSRGEQELETLAQAVLELKHSDLGVQTIGTRHGEKLFEVLVTSEEMLRAEDLPGFFRIRADSRDLNYDNYFSKGNAELSQIEPYTSHNTQRLDLNGMKRLLQKLKLFGGNC